MVETISDKILLELDKVFPKDLAIADIRRIILNGNKEWNDPERKNLDEALKTMLNGALLVIDDHEKLERALRMGDSWALNVDTIHCRLSDRGYELIHPIGIKYSLNELALSLDNFNRASTQSFDTLTKSIEKFNISSKRLTWILIAITTVVAIVATIQAIRL